MSRLQANGFTELAGPRIHAGVLEQALDEAIGSRHHLQQREDPRSLRTSVEDLNGSKREKRKKKKGKKREKRKLT
jgi:hypothetical protein